MLKESKSDRFIRIVQARVNKLINMIRLLGNCSAKGNYEFTNEQVEQIFSALHTELFKAHKRYTTTACQKKPFSLSDRYEEIPDYPHTDLLLPDGTTLRATAVDDENFPAVDIDLIDLENHHERVCFVEYNPERSSCYKVCIGVYQSDKDETVFYEQYVRDKHTEKALETQGDYLGERGGKNEEA